MKHALNIVMGFCLLVGPVRAAEPMKWVSPNGSHSIVLSYGKGGEPALTAESNNHSSGIMESPLIASPISREFGGMTWLSDVAPKWIDNRYLAFEAEDRLVLLDAESKIMILNTAFETLAKAPSGDRWSAVRYRGVGRKQEKLADNFQDVLFVIDFQQVIKATAAAGADAKPFSHLKSLKLPGHALAKPIWLNHAGKERLAIGILVTGKPIALVLNPETLDVIEKRPLSIAVSDDSAHSAWIDREAEQKITQAILMTLSESP